MKSEPKAFASLSSGLLARKGAARPAMRPQGFGQGGSGLEDLGWNDMGYDAPKPSLVPVADGEAVHLSRSPLVGLTPVSPVHDQYAEIEQRFTSHDQDEETGDDDIEDEVDETAHSSFASLSRGFEPEPEEEVEADVEEEEPALELSTEYVPAAEEQSDTVPPAAVVDAHAALVPFAFAVDRSAATDSEVAPAVPVLSDLAEEPAPVPAAAPFAVSKQARQVTTQPDSGAKGKAAFTLRLDPSRHLKLRLACAVTGRSAQQLVTRALDELLAAMPELDAMAERAPAERVSRKG